MSDSTMSPLELRVQSALDTMIYIRDHTEEFPILQNKYQLDVNRKKTSVFTLEYVKDGCKYQFSLSVDPKTLKIEVVYKRDRSSLFSASFKKSGRVITGNINPCGDFLSLCAKLREIWR